MPTNPMDSYGAALNNAANLQKTHGGTNHKEDKMLDIHRLDNNEHIFGLDSERIAALHVIFESFTRSTGIFIDEYGDTDLDLARMRFLVKLIDDYADKTDLNADKRRTSMILEFKGLLGLLLAKEIPIKLRGD